MRHPTSKSALFATFVATLVATVVAVPVTAVAADAGRTDVTRTTCAELAADTQENRAFALMFYYGYMAGRSSVTQIEDAKVPGHLNSVREYCNRNPKSTIVQAFVQALKPAK